MPTKKAAKPAKAKSSKPASKGVKAAAKPSTKAVKSSKLTAKPVGKAAAKSAKPAKPAPGTRKVCPASDPFGAPCQNTPRYGSKYCGIHSFLE